MVGGIKVADSWKTLSNDMEMNKALVTGATSGIGAATVKNLTRQGVEVCAIARRRKRLEALAAETRCSWLSCDVRDITKLATRIEDFAPDIIVNNAGVGHGITGMDGLPLEDIQAAFEINVIAPIQIASMAITGMRKRGSGHIVNIGSIAGLHTLVSAVYGGTKAALHQFSRNLRFELRGTGIRVSEICPGRVASEFYERASGDRDKLEKMGSVSIAALQPDDIADAVLYALNEPPHVNIATIELLPTEQAVGWVDMTPAPHLKTKE